jgi:long-chain fatty acid transport protein
MPQLARAPWARVDFSNSNDFSGAARSTGWAGKLGVTWRAAPTVTLGASYQTETDLGDMKTGATGASLSAFGGFADSGRMTVEHFQWPAMLAVGAAWQATPALLLAADVKRIAWSDVMQSFRMRYDSAQMGGSVNFSLPQNWQDQTVLNLGVAWSPMAALTLRGGFNRGSNPIPAAWVHPLFPATVEKHWTLGLGWRPSAAGEFNAALTVAPESKVVNGQGVTVTHAQKNLQLMYSLRF